MNAIAAFQTSVVIQQADSDADLIDIWLNTHRSTHTRRGYTADATAFMAFAGKPLRTMTVKDVLAYDRSLIDCAPATAARRLSSVKSLIAFAHRLGYLPFDIAAPVQLPAVKNTLAQRIMGEDDVIRMLDREPNERNAVLLRLTYNAALRVSEVCALTWQDLAANGDSGQITVMGKGGKTRIILLKASVWSRVAAMRPLDAAPGAPVFKSRQGGPLTPMQVHRIVKAAAERAGLSDAVSTHWLRHAHVSHSLDRGASPALVRDTAGHASLVTTSRYAHARPNDSSALYLAG